MIIEKLFDLFFVTAENSGSLSIKVSLDRLKLLIIMISHLAELTLHSHDQGVNIFRHLLNLFDVVAILLIDLLLKLSD